MPFSGDIQVRFDRFLDVIEHDIVPLTERAVGIGCKVFGAAILRKSDLSLVLSATNHEALSPLWHGEIYAIKLFFELQGHPDPSECVFLATHQPCCLCTSALAWSGFKEIYYLFGYQHTDSDFNIPHDKKMIRDVFGCDEPRASNAYFDWYSLFSMIPSLPDPQAGLERFERIRRIYTRLSDVYQQGEKKMVLK